MDRPSASMIVMIIRSNNNVNYNDNYNNNYYNNIVIITSIGQVQTPGARETVTAFLLSL